MIKIGKISDVSFWINKYGLGIKKILIIEVIIILLSLFFVENSPSLLIINSLPILFFSFLLFQFGFFVSLEEFEVNKKKHRVVYFFLPNKMKKSYKAILYKGGFTSVSPYFDIKLMFLFPFMDIICAKTNILNNALVLGGAGASVPIWLVNNFNVEKVVVVENSERMIEIAKKYFVINSKSKIKFVHGDAIKYMNRNQGYDFIFLDIFWGNKVDKKIISPFFIRKIKKLSNKFLFINFGMMGDEKAHLLFKSYKKIIPDMKIFLIKSNFIGIWEKHPINVYDEIMDCTRLL